jgi:hypothetical protein
MAQQPSDNARRPSDDTARQWEPISDDDWAVSEGASAGGIATGSAAHTAPTDSDDWGTPERTVVRPHVVDRARENMGDTAPRARVLHRQRPVTQRASVTEDAPEPFEEPPRKRPPSPFSSAQPRTTRLSLVRTLDRCGRCRGTSLPALFAL